MKRLAFVFAVAFLFGPVAYLQAQLAPPDVFQAPSSPEVRLIEAHFAPHGGCTQAALAEINAAKTSVLVQAYSFPPTQIATALVEAHKRGVEVKVILDRSNRTENNSAADFIQHAGIPTLIGGVARNEIIILDGQAVVTGSFNFTSAAEENKAENLLVIRDKAIAQQYTANWKEHAQQSEKYESKDAGDSEMPSSVAPATVEATAPVDEPTKKFLASIAGQWHLSYAVPGGGHVSQELIIDSDGNYFVTTRGSTPFFLLRNVFYDPTWRILTFSKVYARGSKKGERVQNEVLKLAPDGNSMTGHAQHDGHSLEYTKVLPRDQPIPAQGTANSKEPSQHSENYEATDASAFQPGSPAQPAAVEAAEPVADPAKKMFASIAGRWRLAYSARGVPRIEELRIDGNGNYFVISPRSAPSFLLRDAFYDPTWHIVAFSKVYAQGPKKGKSRQVEVLKLAPDGNSMTGHAQSDGHSLEYTRVTN